MFESKPQNEDESCGPQEWTKQWTTARCGRQSQHTKQSGADIITIIIIIFSFIRSSVEDRVDLLVHLVPRGAETSAKGLVQQPS